MPYSPSVVDVCEKFAKTFGKPESVYYPGCGDDSSPYVGFPDTDIVFVDPEERSIASLVCECPNATTICTKAENVRRGRKFDLVLSVHSHAPFEAEIWDLKIGGRLIIANKMSDRAFEHSKQLALVGACRWKTGYVHDGLGDIETSDLDKYKEVDPNYRIPTFSNRRKIKAAFYIFERIRGLLVE